jgi:Tfp pilus assembly major pilin PilA
MTSDEASNGSKGRAWPEIILIVLLVVTILAIGLGLPAVQKWVAQRLGVTATPTTVSLPLSIKVDELSNDPTRFKRDDLVTLVILLGKEAGAATEIVEYPDLRVSDITFSNGKPATIVLSVNATDRDAILMSLKDKQALYLQPQETDAVEPVADVTPESAAKAGAPVSTPAPFILLPINVSELASEPVAVEFVERVTLVVLKSDKDDAAAKIPPSSYTDLRVEAVLDANGLDVTSTGRKAHTIRLWIDKDNRDNILSDLKDTNKKAIYLLPQGPDAVTLTAMPEATPTPEPVSIEFELPADKIKSDFSSLELNSNLVVIVVVEHEDSEGKFVAHEAHRHNGVTLLDVLDKNGARLVQPYEEATTMSISLPLGTDDGPAVEFAAHLADASAIYLLPAPPTPTPAPTATQGG